MSGGHVCDQAVFYATLSGSKLPTTPPGYMSAKACTSGKTVLDLWKLADNTNRQLYTVKRTTGTDPGIIGVMTKSCCLASPSHVGNGTNDHHIVAAAAGQRHHR